VIRSTMVRFWLSEKTPSMSLTLINGIGLSFLGAKRRAGIWPPGYRVPLTVKIRQSAGAGQSEKMKKL
jgi:hypothetical protein